MFINFQEDLQQTDMLNPYHDRNPFYYGRRDCDLLRHKKQGPKTKWRPNLSVYSNLFIHLFISIHICIIKLCYPEVTFEEEVWLKGLYCDPRSFFPLPFFLVKFCLPLPFHGIRWSRGNSREGSGESASESLACTLTTLMLMMMMNVMRHSNNSSSSLRKGRMNQCTLDPLNLLLLTIPSCSSRWSAARRSGSSSSSGRSTSWASSSSPSRSYSSAATRHR